MRSGIAGSVERRSILVRFAKKEEERRNTKGEEGRGFCEHQTIQKKKKKGGGGGRRRKKSLGKGKKPKNLTAMQKEVEKELNSP